jgi:hypothetical protein
MRLDLRVRSFVCSAFTDLVNLAFFAEFQTRTNPHKSDTTATTTLKTSNWCSMYSWTSTFFITKNRPSLVLGAVDNRDLAGKKCRARLGVGQARSHSELDFTRQKRPHPWLGFLCTQNLALSPEAGVYGARSVRLQAHAYRVFGEVLAPSRQTIWNGRERLSPIKGSPQERRMRLKQALSVALREYPKTPWAVPTCLASSTGWESPRMTSCSRCRASHICPNTDEGSVGSSRFVERSQRSLV